MKVKTQYFPQIDSLRFVAVILVIISHWLPHHAINQLQISRLGVDLFFVISGFLITRILFQLKWNKATVVENLKVFFARRILRIFPVYYFVVGLTTIANGGIAEEALLWNVFYLSNFFVLYLGHWPGVISHYWSLSVEEHFYLIWPLLILIPKPKNLLNIIVGTTLVAVFMRSYFFFFDYDYNYSYIFTISCFDALAMGALLAYVYHKNNRAYHQLMNHPLLFPVVGIAFLYCLYSINTYGFTDNIFNVVFFRYIESLLFFFIIGKAIKSKASFLHNQKIIFLGKLSYSMYLWHNFVPGFFLGMEYPEHIYLRMLIYFASLFIVSYLSFKLIEMPFNRLKNRFRY